ncbi:MAG: HAD-IA family hydrolase, partial [Acidobacteriota bacterium]
YAIGPPRIMNWLEAAGEPFPVSGPSLALAAACLQEGEDRMQAFVRIIRRERRELAGTLKDLGAAPFPSQGNFVLARFKDPAWVAAALAGLGIAVRAYPDDTGVLSRCLRITCPGDADSFRRLQQALAAALAPEALLLDLDGVLADVSASYREAIRATARLYGVALSPGEIAAAKTEGCAANDWLLTQRLLGRHGRQVSLDEIVARFQVIYHGTPKVPGLRLAETLLVDPSLLERLAASRPLAIVTGRPRAEADWFLKRTGIGSFFASVVTADDAPAKPNPGGPALALKELGVQRAWMVGDAVDDVQAARQAGVVPLAVLPPGGQRRITAAALQRAGAAAVFNRLEEILEKLP